ncbi:hypothetical protein [Dyadobacter sp. 3J3]|uniref:hypothetical protein n=1 Tax=Dyadobacter sp. 3J3 TaxID=2606600 RepID=UPI00135920E9|nr:hypothetical protein [Dyadobacter sp. 3J3]
MWWLIVNIFLLSNCFLGWYVNKVHLPARFVFFGAFAIVTMVCESIAAYYWLVLEKNNLFLFHFLTPVQYVLISLLFQNFGSPMRLHRTILFSYLLVCLFAIYNAIFLQPVYKYNSYTQLLCFTLLICWSLFYLVGLISARLESSLEGNPMFWVSVGTLFCSTTNFIITSMMNYLVERQYDWASKLYDFTTIVAFIMYIVFILGLYASRIFKTY